MMFRRRGLLTTLSPVKRAILLGDSVLRALAVPGSLPAKWLAGGGSGDGEIAWTLIFSALGWPLSVPAAVVFGPTWMVYRWVLDADELRKRARALERY